MWDIIKNVGKDFLIWLLERSKNTVRVVSKPFKKTGHWLSVKKHNTHVKIVRGYRTVIGFCKKFSSELLFFLQLTVGVGFIIWGLETILLSLFGLSIWRVLVGLYIILWCGLAYVWQIMKIGIYLSK